MAIDRQSRGDKPRGKRPPSGDDPRKYLDARMRELLSQLDEIPYDVGDAATAST